MESALEAWAICTRFCRGGFLLEQWKPIMEPQWVSFQCSRAQEWDSRSLWRSVYRISLQDYKLYKLRQTRVRLFFCTAKTKYLKLETNIPCKGISRPQYQFPHSCVCERFKYSHDRPAYSAAGKYVGRSWESINRSQTHFLGTEAVQVCFWGYRNWIFVAVSVHFSRVYSH